MYVGRDEPLTYSLSILTCVQIGPGIVYLKWQTSMGRGAFIQSLTPEEPLLQRMTNVVYCSKWIPAFIGTLMLFAEVVQVGPIHATLRCMVHLH